MRDERQLDPEELGDHTDRLYRAAWGLCGGIATLPPDFRDVLIAIDLVGLSYREAAQSLRVREATITSRLHRARQRIAKSLAVHSGPD